MRSNIWDWNMESEPYFYEFVFGADQKIFCFFKWKFFKYLSFDLWLTIKFIVIIWGENSIPVQGFDHWPLLCALSVYNFTLYFCTWKLAKKCSLKHWKIVLFSSKKSTFVLMLTYIRCWNLLSYLELHFKLFGRWIIQ